MLDLLDNKEKMAKYYLETRHQDSSVIDDDILAYNNLRDSRKIINEEITKININKGNIQETD